MSKPEEFKFDSRVRDRFLRSRVLSGADVQKHLDELPDLEGEYEVMNDTPQPAVAPPRSEVHDEPLVFDGIRRLQALSEVQSPMAPRYVPPAPPSGGLPAYREPESRPLGTPLRSALMESEISGVGAGAVSAALGAMAAEARGASVFGVPASIPQPPAPPAEEAVPPLTLRSDPSGQAAALPRPEAPAGLVSAVATVDADDIVDAEEEDDDADADEEDDDAEDEDDEDDADDDTVDADDDTVDADDDDTDDDADEDEDDDGDEDEDEDDAAKPDEEDLA